MSKPDPIHALMRAERERRGWSLSDAAAKVGISPGAIGMWERGDRHCTLEQARRYLAALDHDLIAVGDAEPPSGVALWRQHAVILPGGRIVRCRDAGEASALAVAAGPMTVGGVTIPGARAVTRLVYAGDWQEVSDG